MESSFRDHTRRIITSISSVAILVLMESSFRVRIMSLRTPAMRCRNPCFNGKLIQSLITFDSQPQVFSRNPCFNGKLIQRKNMNNTNTRRRRVAILVLMESSFREPFGDKSRDIKGFQQNFNTRKSGILRMFVSVLCTFSQNLTFFSFLPQRQHPCAPRDCGVFREKTARNLDNIIIFYQIIESLSR